jgi:sec-independent protein translocase protein TatB
MFNIGGAELLVIALIALVVVGPEQLPAVMRKVGGFVSQVRGMTTGLRDEFMSGVDEINPNNWMGDGSDDSPIVPRGYAANTIAEGPKVSEDNLAKDYHPELKRADTDAEADTNAVEAEAKASNEESNGAEAGTPADLDPPEETT